MSYSENKDKLIKLFECGNEQTGALHFSIFSYDSGPSKMQITRMFLKKDNTHGYGKAGRLAIDEMKYLRNNIDNMIQIMEEEE